MSELYPEGPADEKIWLRAGGDLSRIKLTGTGRAQWYAALRTLQLGGGGAEMSTSNLLRAALEDFPQQPDLLAAITAP